MLVLRGKQHPASAGTFSARADTVSPLDAHAFGQTAARLTKTIAAMHVDLATEHIKLLVNALYWDGYKDDEFRRLHYLSLRPTYNPFTRRPTMKSRH